MACERVSSEHICNTQWTLVFVFTLYIYLNVVVLHTVQCIPISCKVIGNKDLERAEKMTIMNDNMNG